MKSAMSRKKIVEGIHKKCSDRVPYQTKRQIQNDGMDVSHKWCAIYSYITHNQLAYMKAFSGNRFDSISIPTNKATF